MPDDFDAAFSILDSFEGFALLGLAFGQAKLYFETDLPAYEVQEYLEQCGIRSDCWQFTDGVVVAIAGADKERARWLLENWGTS